MEDVLEVYQRPHDPECPVVCLDETSKQLIAETRVPIPAKPGQPVRHDYEYERNGTANLFMMFAPLEGWRHVEVTDRHTAVDYAQILKDISDTHFPTAKKIVLVQDNLNIHKPASLYEAFPAAEARRLVERFEWTSYQQSREKVRGGNPADREVYLGSLRSILDKRPPRLLQSKSGRQRSRPDLVSRRARDRQDRFAPDGGLRSVLTVAVRDAVVNSQAGTEKRALQPN